MQHRSGKRQGFSRRKKEKTGGSRVTLLGRKSRETVRGDCCKKNNKKREEVVSFLFIRERGKEGLNSSRHQTVTQSPISTKLVEIWYRGQGWGKRTGSLGEVPWGGILKRGFWS